MSVVAEDRRASGPRTPQALEARREQARAGRLGQAAVSGEQQDRQKETFIPLQMEAGAKREVCEVPWCYTRLGRGEVTSRKVNVIMPSQSLPGKRSVVTLMASADISAGADISALFLRHSLLNSVESFH